jgi:hypothetical protein
MQLDSYNCELCILQKEERPMHLFSNAHLQGIVEGR